MPTINNIFVALRLRTLQNPVDCSGIAMLFSGEVCQFSGKIINRAPAFGIAHRTSVPILRGDPPTP